MTSAREDALGTGAVGPGERSVVRTLRGLRWWAALALAAVLTVAGVAIDLLTAGELGVVFTACFAGGCILATAWARRDSLFVPLVQPPLLLAVAVPAVVVASGSLPRSGGTASALLAVGGPLVNGFPTLAITAAICLALGFVRSRLEPYQRPEDDLDPDARPPRDPRDRRTRATAGTRVTATPATATPATGAGAATPATVTRATVTVTRGTATRGIATPATGTRATGRGGRSRCGRCATTAAARPPTTPVVARCAPTTRTTSSGQACAACRAASTGPTTGADTALPP